MLRGILVNKLVLKDRNDTRLYGKKLLQVEWGILINKTNYQKISIPKLILIKEKAL